MDEYIPKGIEGIVGTCFKAERRPYEMIHFVKVGNDVYVRYYDSMEDPSQHETVGDKNLRTEIFLTFPSNEFERALQTLHEKRKCSLREERGNLVLTLTQEGFSFEINYFTKYGGVPMDFKEDMMHVKSKVKWKDVYNRQIKEVVSSKEGVGDIRRRIQEFDQRHGEPPGYDPLNPWDD